MLTQDLGSRLALPRAVRIGTVDKFQGQQALVVLYSLASSTSDDIPRGLEFLLSRNRLNVAIIVWAVDLEQARARDQVRQALRARSSQMRLANALCRFVELATEQVE